VVMILLIEDEDFTADLIARLLAPAEVRRARNGSQGLALFQNEPFDLIITYLVMPTMDGLSTIAAIRKLDRAVPILAMSSSGSLATKGDLLALAMRVGANATLMKPFDREPLMDKVRECLAARPPRPG
jgi:DNA-binding response OmpR family regulator